ncbi:MAG: hypothetical protein ACYC7G_10705, partial [Rudaea sp.]
RQENIHFGVIHVEIDDTSKRSIIKARSNTCAALYRVSPDSTGTSKEVTRPAAGRTEALL